MKMNEDESKELIINFNDGKMEYQDKIEDIIESHPTPVHGGYSKWTYPKSWQEKLCKIAKYTFAVIVVIILTVLVVLYTQEMNKSQETEKTVDGIVAELQRAEANINESWQGTKDIDQLKQNVTQSLLTIANLNKSLSELKLAIQKERTDTAESLEILVTKNEAISAVLAGIRVKLNRLEQVVGNVSNQDNRLNAYFKEMNRTIEEMNKVIRRFDSVWCKYHGGIEYSGSCLWEEDEPENMTLINAYRLCNKIAPSTLPEIHSKEEFNQIMAYLRSKVPSGETYVNTWTGMTREHWTQQAMLSNGEQAPYTKTLPTSSQWDTAEITRTNIYLHARKDNTDNTQGMGALSPSTKYSTVKTLLCQRLPALITSKLPQEEEVWCENIGGIAYNGSCLWAEDPPDDMTLSRALEVCNERKPSKLPEVYGGYQYIEIMEYMRTKIKTTYIIAWTGMTRNITTNQAMMSDGFPAPYTKPRTKDGRWEEATDDKTNVYLIAGVNTALSDEGMGSIAPTYEFETDQKIVLCQKL